MTFIQGQEKVRNNVVGQGNSEMTGKVREMSRNLKINGFGSLHKINLIT